MNKFQSSSNMLKLKTNDKLTHAVIGTPNHFVVFRNPHKWSQTINNPNLYNQLKIYHETENPKFQTLIETIQKTTPI